MPASFGSDNHSGVHPDVLAALAAVNEGPVPSYGHDPVTARFEERVREVFGPDARAYPVFNGTGANVLALRAACRPWEAVICTDSAHLHVDECAAPEVMGGVKLLTAPTPDGKLTPELVRERVVRVGDEHAAQARVVSLAQSSELGTVYSVEELAALRAVCAELGLLLHVDGARLGNAAAALGTELSDLTGDVVSLGGTKAGLLGAEAVVFLRPGLDDGFLYLRKQSMQLASKMRFLSAQLELFLSDRWWHGGAAHANAMAARLEQAVRGLPGVEITQPVQANAIFAVLPAGAADRIRAAGFPFYDWDEARREVRWMCSWDTRPEDVDAFAGAVAEALR